MVHEMMQKGLLFFGAIISTRSGLYDASRTTLVAVGVVVVVGVGATEVGNVVQASLSNAN